MALPFIPIVLGALPHLKKYWKELAIVGIIGLAAYQNFSETRFLFWLETIPSLEKRLQISQDNMKKCKDGNDNLKADIKKTNDEIDEWKAVSTANEGIIEKLEGELDEARTKTNNTVNTVLQDPTPKTCEAAIEYLRDGVEDIKW